MEIAALLELLGMLVLHPGTGALMALLLIAAVIDWRTMRIPNWLTVSGMVYGLVFNATHSTSVTAGLVTAGLGLAVGLVLLLPLYAIRVMGAGDVKLMAMVGAFLGAGPTLKALLFILVIGGCAAFAFALSHQATARFATNMRNLVYSMAIRGAPLWRPEVVGVSVGRMPYGVSIALGTSTFLVARQIGFI